MTSSSISEERRVDASVREGGGESTPPPAYRRAVEAARRGEHETAMREFRNAIEEVPGHQASHANLGTALSLQKEYGEAAGSFRRAMELDPRDWNSRANLAACLLELDCAVESVELAEQVLEVTPNHAGTLRTFVRGCLATREPTRALAAARTLARVAPAREHHELLIKALVAEGIVAEAEAEADRYIVQARRAVKRSQLRREAARKLLGEANLLRAQTIRNRIRALHHTGSELQLLRERRLEVARLLEHVVADAPSSEAYFELGCAYHDLHWHAKAEEALRKAVSLDGTNPTALERLGDVLIERSRNGEAVQALDRSLAANPRQSKALLMRIRTAPDESKRDELHERLDEYLADPGASPMDRINWHYCKAQLYDQAKDYDRAFENYLAGGKLKDETRKDALAKFHDTIPDDGPDALPDHADRHTRIYEGARRVYTQDFFEKHRAAASDSNRPIFVVGVPRSGTTLTEQILASHRDVVGAGELPDICSYAARCDKVAQVRGGYPESIQALSTETLRSFANEYLAQLDAVDRSAMRVVDKMPGNLIHVGLIHTLFPNASIVRIRREPRDVVVSALKNHLDFPFCVLENTARFCVSCDRITELWNELLPGRILEIQYEELVTDLEPNVRRMLEHCGLDWDPRCLDFHETERNVRTPSRWQVRKPAYRSSIGSWKRYAKYLTHLDDILGPVPE